MPGEEKVATDCYILEYSVLCTSIEAFGEVYDIKNFLKKSLSLLASF